MFFDVEAGAWVMGGHRGQQEANAFDLCGIVLLSSVPAGREPQLWISISATR